MRILVIGAEGQLGKDMMLQCAAAGHDSLGRDVPEIDISDRNRTISSIQEIRPEVIVNTAAFTVVDACEEKRELAFKVNGEGAGNVAAAAAAMDARLVHISTDYVFSGAEERPYTEADEPDPRSVYGKSKLAGEQAVARELERRWVVRIAWLYGMHGANFVTAIRRAARQKAAAGEPLFVVNDQRGSPTWTVTICQQILRLIEVEEYGVFHCTSEGACSWYDFAREIVSAAGIAVDVLPCTTEQFPRPAKRPANSVLENARLKALGINSMPDWRDAFDRFCAAEAESGR